MKIRTEQLQVLAREQAQKGKSSQGVGFDDLLAKKMQEGKTDSSQAVSRMSQQAAVPQVGIPGLNPLFANQQMGSSMNQKEIANTMNGVLDQLEQYAAKLGSPDVSLRSVYEELQGIGQQMDRLRKTMQSGETPSPELDALYTEMDILATTETFKLNRGDYSSLA